MTALTIEVRGRLRRRRLVTGTVRVAVWLAPVIGRRTAVRIANLAARHLRLDMRIGTDKWRRVPFDVPQWEAEP